jgi:hypothetical protein
MDSGSLSKTVANDLGSYWAMSITPYPKKHLTKCELSQNVN